MANFDPYLAWLDIPAHERPVNNYRLLGLVPGEMDAAKIEAAANRVKAHLQQFASGEYADEATKLMGVVEGAKASVLGAARATSAVSEQSRAAHGETAIKPPPPVPGAPAPTAPQHGPVAGERQMSAAPPPPGSAPRSGEMQVKPPPPVPGAAGATPNIPAPTIPGAPSVAPPGASGPNFPAPPAVPGGPPQGPPPATPIAPPPSAPTAPAAGRTESSMPGGPAAPPAPSPPVASPPTAAPPVTPPAQPATPVQPPAATPGSAPSWAPAGRTGTVGKSVTAATEGSPQLPVRTRKASTLRHRARRESQAVANSLLFGVAAIIIGLIILLVLVAVT